MSQLRPLLGGGEHDAAQDRPGVSPSGKEPESGAPNLGPHTTKGYLNPKKPTFFKDLCKEITIVRNPKRAKVL